MKDEVSFTEEPLAMEHFLLCVIIWLVGLTLGMLVLLEEMATWRYLKACFLRLPLNSHLGLDLFPQRSKKKFTTQHYSLRYCTRKFIIER